jgi:nucleoside-diphosphate-sugar epimerase
VKVLITGIAGFIGSHMAEYLHKKGFEVEGIDNFSNYYSPALKRINASELASLGIRIWEGDLTDDSLYSKLGTSCQFIIHFAAQPGIAATSTFQSYFENNVIATQKLLQFAKQQTQLKQFVNIGTSSIYGMFATQSEDATIAPTSYYGVTKLAAEQLALAEGRLGNINACSLRLYSVYGPRERPDKLYTKLMIAGIFDEKFPLFEGSKSHKRSFTYVADIVEGIYLNIKNYQQTNGEIINLGSPEQRTTEEGILRVEKLLKKQIDIKILPPRNADQQETVAIITKAKKMLGYQPKTSLEEGLKQQLYWYKDLIKKHGRI